MFEEILYDKRKQYALLNETFSDKLFFVFGRGYGFSAEFIHLLKCVEWCLRNHVQLVLNIQKPRGISINRGWEDYFKSLWPTKRSHLLSFLNRSHFPLGRYPIIKTVASQMLRTVYGRNFLFIFDNLSNLRNRDFPKVVDEKLQIQMSTDWWLRMRELAHLIWVYNDDVSRRIVSFKEKYELKKNQKYIGIHVRRGDKIQESPYVPIRRYIDLLASYSEVIPIFIATDDVRCTVDLRRAFPKRDIFFLTGMEQQGYDQGKFNNSAEYIRFEQMVRFLFELEMLADAETFIGSSPSNVFFLIQYLRAACEVVDVGQII